DPREHERRERVVDHRLVVDGDELLADREREGPQARPGAAGEDDALQARPRAGVRSMVGVPSAQYSASFPERGFGDTPLTGRDPAARRDTSPTARRRTSRRDRGTSAR